MDPPVTGFHAFFTNMLFRAGDPDLIEMLALRHVVSPRLLLISYRPEAEPLYLGFYTSARERCTRCTEIAPSPTAEATRFTLPDRTSPTANTPGRVVSSI